MAESAAAVQVEGLVKRYGGRPALDGFDLCVRAGTVHGLLGPNGAGKTTAVRILTTLLRPDAGRARVAGYDVVRDPVAVRTQIGLVGQHAAVDEILSGRQNLVMFGRLYHLPAATARRRADELLDRFGLADTGSKPVRPLLRRHAAAPRPRREPDPRPAGALPRRADHRARPAQPGRGLGSGPWPGRRWHHRPAHHPVPGRGRPTRRPDLGGRPRPDHRRGEHRAAQVAARRGPDRRGGPDR